ncbi:efflux transporter outer membrane subunit [Novosphingobium sp. AP12]|uniref:efflux transporter outer membrane subunit n=1 Tax=Novosphingobium sp. AP12 TaxID=1144305 RepID=UPI000271F12E|nr:efflux transporter outer membrane subunit [Novosphingobium sp. AP12]EJL33097.1 efflux transporter, outer membrane factor lipoprotein, NodT family [Novosphingobium sp. AP12]
MRRRISSAILLALGVSACSLAPDYRRPAMPVPLALADEPRETAPVPATTTDLPSGWQTFIAEPRLRQLAAMAIANNRDLRLALANVDMARAQYRIRRADLFPTIAAGGQANLQRLSADTPAGSIGSNAPGSSAGDGSRRIDTYSAGASLNAWEIDLFGRLRNENEAALQRYLATDMARSSVQMTLIAELSTLYVRLGADQDRLRTTIETQKAFGVTQAIVLARHDAGAASALEVRQAITAYENVRAQVQALTTSVAQDRNALDLIAGAPVPADLLPDGIPTAGITLRTLPGELPSTVLLSRPDIQQAEHELQAANADIGAARAAFFPSLSLVGALGTLSTGIGGLFAGGSNYWAVTPQASFSIFDAGRAKGGIRYAEAEKRAMLARYERSIQSGFRESADALARRQTLGSEVDARQLQRNAAREAYTLAQARFRSGLDPFLVTLDSERAYYAAELALLAIRETREASSIALFRALGGWPGADVAQPPGIVDHGNAGM